MIDNPTDGHDAESVCEPLIRCEATFHAAPAFRYLDEMQLSESEPCPVEPMKSVQTASAIDVIETLFLRPQMYFPEAKTLNEFLVFVCGVWRGQAGPNGHGFQGESEFSDYVSARFQQSPLASWTTTLGNEFADKPFIEACAAIAQVVRDWKALKRGT